MARVLLISPPLESSELYSAAAKATASIIPPLGLAYIAAVLEKEGHKVQIIDGIVEDISIAGIINKAGDFDLIGITVATAFFKRCAELVRALKNTLDKTIIAGGPHATAMPLSLLECGVDYAVIGEGEETIRELARFLEEGSFTEAQAVRGIAFLRDGKMTLTEKRPLIEDLDCLPLPARHLLPMHRYKTSEARSYANPSHSMVVSRGCPGKCTFCSKLSFGSRFRHNSPKRIVEEMFILADKYKAKEIAFLDDSFTSDRDLVLEVCSILTERKFTLPWSCESRIDAVDSVMLQAMKDAGCGFIAYGIESGSDAMLKKVNKGVTTGQIKRIISLTKEAGLSIRGYFMLGFIGESEDQMLETIGFASSLNIDVASFSLFVPFPGALDYRKAIEEGGDFDAEFFYKEIIPEFNFPNQAVYCPKGISRRRLLQIHRMAYRKFYWRPQIILKELAKVKNMQDIRRIFRAGTSLIRGQLNVVT